MHGGSRLVGHARTHVQMQCCKYNVVQCNAVSLKIEKEGKPHGKNPPPKLEISTIKKSHVTHLVKNFAPPRVRANKDI